jgi:predicted ATPase/DNA-binding SARP family transcriptional activator
VKFAGVSSDRAGSGASPIGFHSTPSRKTRLALFGTPRLIVDGQPVRLVSAGRSFAVLAFLALRRDSVARDELAFAVWPDQTAEAARANLRRHLLYVDDACTRAGVAKLIVRGADRLQLDAARVDVDLWQFQDAARDESASAEAIDASAQDFLAGYEDEWADQPRRRLHDERIARIGRLMDAAVARGDPETMSRWARAMLEDEPYREDALRVLVRACHDLGDASGALAVYAAFARRLATELGTEPSAETRALVKRLGRAGASRTAQLPLESTRFFGRERDLVELAHLLEAGRVVVCVGPPGVGKTRLAIRAAHSLEHRFADGVVYVDLAPVAEGERVEAVALAAAADAFGEQVADLRALVAGREVLFLIDNCENVTLAVARFVRSLTRSAPLARVLATSRRSLGLSGEALWRVDPLAVPHPAVDLFLERARLVRPIGEVGTLSATLVEEICALLDGLPLALELAAARLRSLSLEELRRRLADRFRLLRSQSRRGTRHGTLDALFERSFAELGPRDRELILRLSVFQGGWSVAAAAAVGALDEWETIDALERLVDQSLVVPPPVGLPHGHFRLLQSVREYALSLATGAERDLAREAHARYFAAWVSALAVELDGPLAHARFDEVDADIDNIRAALKTLIVDTVDPEAGATICIALVRFFYFRGHVVEAEDWLRRTLASESISESMRLRLHIARAIAIRNQHDFAEALRRFEEVRRLVDATGDTERSATLALHVADCARTLGRYHDARELALSSHATFEAAKDDYMAAYALSELGLIAIDCNDLDAALEHTEAAMRFFESVASDTDVVVCAANLSIALLYRNDLQGAERAARFAAERARDLGVKFVEAGARLILATVELAAGRLAAARRELETGFELALAINDYERLAESLELAAKISLTVDHAASAAEQLGAAERMRERCGARLRPREEEALALVADRCRSMLGPKGYAAAFRLGSVLPLETVLAGAHGPGEISAFA